MNQPNNQTPDQPRNAHGSGERNEQKQVPVTILTGFLGSGKTTLLNYILTEKHGLRIAVIENEFGEIDVDSDLVLTSEEEIFQMTNGCICCVVDVRTDLVRILQTLLARSDKFDHILVETSGLADPTPVAATFFMDNEVARQVCLDGVVTLVDALHIDSHLSDPALAGMDNQAVDQIVAADRIIINKTDLVDDAALQLLERRIRGINQGAQIMRSSHAQVDLGKILGIGGFASSSVLACDPHFMDEHEHVCDDVCAHEHGHEHGRADAGAHGARRDHGHAHDPSVLSVSFTFGAPFNKQGLDAYLAQLLAERGDDLFRLKGILSIAGEGRRYVLQAVHRVLELRAADAWDGAAARSSKLVFIGRNLDRAGLDAGLRACIETPAPRAILGLPGAARATAAVATEAGA
ncbi:MULTISPECIES: CobW family GTP-binding protein [unclassified Janthinobacterium]|uniref:CobW family GTP-binding protein n=1 Tax=unclassified Janthinobacterium TaxID=2610881 RepID=UPI0003485236|nr:MULTISPECIES: GTP-binding protein [unclassified Janthinobacterium]MEC5160700.1 G3E family GTPase [Janthinobacterium sp. CG_S6]